MFLRYDPMGVGSFIELPKTIKGKRSLLNIKNEDESVWHGALRHIGSVRRPLNEP